MRNFLSGCSEMEGLVFHLFEIALLSVERSPRRTPRLWGRPPSRAGTDQHAALFQQGGESDGFFHPEGQPQRLPQPPEVRQQPARKVTLTKGALQQPQHPPVGPHVHSAGPPAIKSIQGVHPAKKVLLVTEAEGRERGDVLLVKTALGVWAVLRWECLARSRRAQADL